MVFSFGSSKTKYTTPEPGKYHEASATRGHQIMAEAYGQLFGVDPKSFNITGSGGQLAGGLFGGKGEGGFGGLLGQMMGQLGGGYDSALGALGQSEKFQRGEAMSAGKQNLANLSQSMAKSGMGNSTVQASMARGLNYDTQRTLQGISTQADQLRSQLEVGRGQALAQGTQFGIGAQQDAMMKMIAFMAGTAGQGPSGWNALFRPGGPVVGSKSEQFGGQLGG